MSDAEQLPDKVKATYPTVRISDSTIAEFAELSKNREKAKRRRFECPDCKAELERCFDAPEDYHGEIVYFGRHTT